MKDTHLENEQKTRKLNSEFNTGKLNNSSYFVGVCMHLDGWKKNCSILVTVAFIYMLQFVLSIGWVRCMAPPETSFYIF